MNITPSSFQNSGTMTLFYAGVLFLLIYIITTLSRSRHTSSWRLTACKGRPVSNETDYSDVFPPSQRKKVSLLISNRKARVERGIDLSRHSHLLLKLETDYRFARPEQLVFSGFSIEDIRSFGTFPDYATLSEVPLPAVAKDFDLATAKARPYRPLRWPYHQTMAIQRMEPDYWIELESTYEDQIRQRKNIVQQHTTDVLQALPGSELACRELMEMVIQFLCARYPHYFSLAGRTLTNNILGVDYDILDTNALHFLLENVPEDFAIMIRDPATGKYKFRAGIICASTGWNLGEKIGKGLSEIHGPVPDYRERMQLSMDRFFTKLPTSKPVQRGAWGFEVGQHLYTPPGHSGLEGREKQYDQLHPDDIYFRVDWQTLRRLPLSGAIVFNFKAFFTPVAELKDEPYIPSLCLKVLTESSKNLRQYKQVYHTEHILRPLLSDYERVQIETGTIEFGWEHQTLEESPFFPGWEKKYMALHINNKS